MKSRMNVLTGAWLVVLFVATGTAAWGLLFTWLGWKMGLGATITFLGSLVGTRKLLKARKRRWVPLDAHDIATRAVDAFGLTLEEGWEVVEIMEEILDPVEYTDHDAWKFFRVFPLQLGKTATMEVLRALVQGQHPWRESYLRQNGQIVAALTYIFKDRGQSIPDKDRAALRDILDHHEAGGGIPNIGPSGEILDHTPWPPKEPNFPKVLKT